MALACTRLEFPRDQEPVAVTLLKRWLGSWGGIGLLAAGMARHGYDLQLTRYDEEGVAGDVPRLREGTLTRAGHAHGVGADALARCPGRGVGGAEG
jgi:hypothetical protein